MIFLRKIKDLKLNNNCLKFKFKNYKLQVKTIKKILLIKE